MRCLLVGLLLAGCTSPRSSRDTGLYYPDPGGESGDGATVALSLANDSPDPTAARADGSQPAALGIKLIAVYVAEAIDPSTHSNVDANGDGVDTAMVYLNPQCIDDDIMHCDVSGGTAEDGQPMSHVISDYFDFAAPTDEVNEALAAQQRAVAPQSYSWARMEFCKMNAEHEATVRWESQDGVALDIERCAAATVAIDPPLLVQEGDALTLELAYDLSSAVIQGDEATGESCIGEGDSRTCFTLPQFVPSVWVE